MFSDDSARVGYIWHFLWVRYGGYSGYGTVGTVRWVRYSGYSGPVVRYGWYGGYGTVGAGTHPLYPPYRTHRTHRTVPTVPTVPYPPYPPYRTHRTHRTVPTVPTYRTTVPNVPHPSPYHHFWGPYPPTEHYSWNWSFIDDLPDFTSWKRCFSISILDYQRVHLQSIHWCSELVIQLWPLKSPCSPLKFDCARSQCYWIQTNFFFDIWHHHFDEKPLTTLIARMMIDENNSPFGHSNNHAGWL